MSTENFPEVRLTQYSHGGGCGCKISPSVLEQILSSQWEAPDDQRLLVGNHTKDDAAAYDLGNGTALLSTTDFFMPIVDDPFDFGRIASANAISDVYAMGGKPLLAIAILGWPVSVLPASVARRVIEGSRSVCKQAGIPLAGGHSIDSPEPIFGLAVNGLVDIRNLKQNNRAKSGDVLFLTKKLGVGILTTAEKKGLLQQEDKDLATRQMAQLNQIGEVLGGLAAVHAMTDVTGFGLLGHLIEMAEGSGLSAVLDMERIPRITARLGRYIEAQCLPGGTFRNWDSYGQRIALDKPAHQGYAKALLADPQTSGGLLIAVAPDAAKDIAALLKAQELYAEPIGSFRARQPELVLVRNMDSVGT
jgi:selenide, water dikinase